MVTYYLIKDVQKFIRDIYFVVDTLNAYVPGYYDKIRCKNIPTSGGYSVFIRKNKNTFEHLGNYESLEQVNELVVLRSNLNQNTRICNFRISEEQFNIEINE